MDMAIRGTCFADIERIGAQPIM